jgi:hypothetical protein
MRTTTPIGIAVLLAAALSAGCGSDSSGPGVTTLLLRSPAITIAAGADTTYCVFLHTGNSDTIAIKSWAVTLPTGVASAALLFTDTDAQPVGTVTASTCGPISAGATPATLIFESRVPTAHLDFPADDGSGTPVAAIVPPGQSLYLRIRFINPTAAAIAPRAMFTATSYPAGTAVTRADPFVTYAASLSIPATSVGQATDDCATPSGASFFRLTMLTNRLGTLFEIRDGTTLLYSGDDWTDPGELTALTQPFVTFTSDQLTYTCSYNNTTNATVTAGDSPTSDETCITAAWYFPSTGPQQCIDGTILPSPAAARMATAEHRLPAMPVRASATRG